MFGDSQRPLRELRERGYCVLKNHFPRPLIDGSREAFWPVLSEYLKTNRETPNRGPHRHFLPVPFTPPCFAPEFFFDRDVLNIVRAAMDDRVVADQWGCDVPLCGSVCQTPHADYQRPLFPEQPGLALPTYMLVVSFALVPVTSDNGPIEIASGTHRLPRQDALRAVEASEIAMEPVLMEVGDVLIRHPWTLHRGSPNATEIPRALLSIRYTRRWYVDDSREVRSIPQAVWASLSPVQRELMRFPLSSE